ncbi:MAG TPA: sulfite exporter TauE/SafE family protein [Acidimicrobiia bacterium]|nr:sulfite exporter TauE/SafE family protein [Acidimicrobiia bacterium]
MRAVLASPLGFLVGLSLGALGGGGSILAVPALVYAAGQDPQAATTSSLVLVGFAAAVGLQPHLRAGRVRVRTGLMFGVAGVGGSIVGSVVNRRLDPDVLLLAFSGLVLVAAWRMLTACPTCTRVGEASAVSGVSGDVPDGGDVASGGGTAVTVERGLTRSTVVAIVAAGTAVGFMTGLFGVGGGFVIVPALTLLLGLNMPTAIGTSLLVVAVNVVAALGSRLATTSIDWEVTIPFGIAAAVGVLTGGRLADRLDPERSLRAFATLLVAVGAYTAIDAASPLV